MAKRPYQNLILLTINKHSGLDRGEEDKEICLLAWQVIDTIKIQAVTDVEIYHICSEAATKTNSTGTASPKTLPLGKALEKLQSFLSTYSNQEHAIVTNGYRPLRQMLFPEVVKKKLTIPPSLYQFFDICKEMNKKSNSNQFDDLFSICKFLGVDCTSDSPSGEEELKVMAEVVQKMIMQDHKFDSPEMIQQHYQHSSQVNDVCEGCVVKLRGLPYSADHKDIAVFLSGLNIIPGGVVFNINQVGRRTGEAIVVLEDEQQTSLALERDHHYLNQRYIEVFEAEPDDFLELTGNTGADNVFVIKMQGLPYRATEEDIVSFFEPDCKVKNDSNGVMIIRYPDGKATGDAFCLFPTEIDVEEALKKQRHIMSGRYIELFYSSVKEFLVVLNKSGSPEQLDTFAFINPKASSTSSITAAKRGSEKNCLKLRGLPWEATPENIIDFFGSNSKNIEHQGIHMVLNSQNRPTGDCYVQMNNVESAQRASSSLHKKCIGKRYIEVFQCSRDEVTYALMDSSFSGHSSGGSNASQGFSKRRRSNGIRIKARGLPYSADEADLIEFFHDFNVNERDIEMIYNHQGRPTGVAFISFSSQSEADRAIRALNHQYIGSRYVELTHA